MTIGDAVPTIVEQYLSETVRNRAIRLGYYQRDVLLSNASAAGSDLRGKAASYGAQYARHRRSAIARINAALSRERISAASELRLVGGRWHRVIVWYAGDLEIAIDGRSASWTHTPGTLAGMVTIA